MGIQRYRRFRTPVLGRLTWAWVMFAAAAGAFSVYSAVVGGKADGPTRVALALAPEMERLAPPLARAPETTSVLQDAAATVAAIETPILREPGVDEPYFADGEDALGGASTSGAPYTEDRLEIEPADIIITVDGAPARNPGQQVIRPQVASLTRSFSKIPDPDPALLQKTPLGKIPKISRDGRRASHFYASANRVKRGKPAVAIIVGGLGLNRELTERAIDDLPPNVTLAFAPYAKDLEFWTRRARQAGHEIMVELPMESHGGSADALGPAALLTSRSTPENLQRLDWLLSRFGGYFAATNYLGGKFSADQAAIGSVVARLNELGVAYVDDTGAARRALNNASAGAVVNRVIAPGANGEDLQAARRDLMALETLAARNGEALGKAYLYDATISAIGEWAKGLEDRDLALAPASLVLRKRSSDG